MAQPPSTEWQCFRIKVQSDLTAAAARLLKGLGTEVVLCCQQFHQPLKSRCFCCCQSHFFPPEFPFFILAFFHLLAFEIFHGMAFLVWFPPLKHHCLMASWPGRLPKSNSFPDSWNVERRTSRRQWGPSNWSHWTSPCILSWKKKGAWAWVPEQIPQKTKQKSWCDSKLDVWIGPNFWANLPTDNGGVSCEKLEM